MSVTVVGTMLVTIERTSFTTGDVVGDGAGVGVVQLGSDSIFADELVAAISQHGTSVSVSVSFFVTVLNLVLVDVAVAVFVLTSISKRTFVIVTSVGSMYTSVSVLTMVRMAVEIEEIIDLTVVVC